MSNIVRIPSKLYNSLDQKGGAKLIAYYAMVKYYKDDIKYYAYKAKNNKTVSGSSLIRSKTNISLNSIRKYNPQIIELGLSYFDHKADYVLKGNRKLKKEYGQKLVPIRIGKNLIKTQYNILSVKINSAYNNQQKEISKKKHRSEILSHKNNPRSNREARKIKSLISTFGTEIIVNDKAILSNQSYAKIKDGSIDNKSKGQYWKKVLVKNGIVITERVYEFIKKMSYEQYLVARQNSNYVNIIYRKGFLCLESISSFKPIDLVSMT